MNPSDEKAPIDPVALTAELIRCPSVTPAEGGALVLLEELLSEAGFNCTRVDRGETSNLYARWGTSAPVFGFNGHTDVVPVGNPDDWSRDPFSGEIDENGILHGRGATDMKSGVAAFAAAAIDFVNGPDAPDGSVVLAITGDEEGPATDGTVALLDWMENNGEQLDVCLVGEPTCPNEMGEMMKVGRRGSITGYFTVQGKQGHAAYPHRAINPLVALSQLVNNLSTHQLDEGTEHFDPSTLVVTTIDTGNTADNVIPAAGRFTCNIRFNDAHNPDSLKAWMQAEADKVAKATGTQIEVRFRVSGDSFLTPPGDFSALIAQAVQAETNRVPVMSTSGGTSDARFIKNHCPVVEFGLVGRTMHEVDERVPVADIEALKRIYTRMLRSYFT